MVIAIVEISMYFFDHNQFLDDQVLLDGLWAGKDKTEIWDEAAGSEVIHGHWYLHKLGWSDGIAMLGIAISCLAGVIGAWGAFAGMIAKKEKPVIFAVFALVISLLLTASAAGLIALH